MSRMYKNTKTWSPALACNFECTYCKPTFKSNLKRQRKNCLKCYDYEPHKHPERLRRFPSSSIIFPFGDSDIYWILQIFGRDYVIEQVIPNLMAHLQRCPHKKAKFQSKAPACFEQIIPYLRGLKDRIILSTTLETNRDEGYELISKAPKPTIRFKDFINLPWEGPREISFEPFTVFDHDILLSWAKLIRPVKVQLGLNSKPNKVQLPEPSLKKFWKFKYELDKFTEVELKNVDRLTWKPLIELFQNQ